jgi:hypothetical protein
MAIVPKMSDRAGVFVFAMGDRLVAVEIEAMPRKIQVLGEAYFAGAGSLGDYDYVRNPCGELVGFAFDLSNREYQLLLPISSVQGVHLNKREAVLLLSGAESWARECIQASSQLYRSRSNNILIALDKWTEFGSLGFRFGRLSDYA